MQHMLMSLGLVVFNQKTTPYNEFNRKTGYKWAQNDRFAQGPAAQFLGPGDDEITIKGQLAPLITGGPGNIETLRLMAATGKAWPLVAGTGIPKGFWYIENIAEDKKHIMDNGEGLIIDFSLDLKRYHGDDLMQLGNLAMTVIAGVLNR